jgi:hypothetical protein
MMKSFIEIFLNVSLRKELDLLFGKESYVIINNIKYSTNTKQYAIHCKLYVEELELANESYPNGLNYLIEESFKFTGADEPFVIISSIEIKN